MVNSEISSGLASVRPNETDLQPGKQAELLVVLTTVTDIDTAKSLAHQIIAQQLVACCNIVPGVSSIYRWQGELRDDQECLLVMKTVKERYLELETFVRSRHPYEVPELLALPVTTCFKEYLSWVVNQTD